MNTTVIPRRLSQVTLVAFALAACAILAAGQARADDRPKMRGSHQDWSQHNHRGHDDRRHDNRRYDNRRYDNGRYHGHRSHNYGWHHYDNRHYGYGASHRYYDRHRRVWVSPYSIELRSWPYSLRYDSGSRYYGGYSTRYPSRYDRYDRYRDCDDDRRYDRDRWDDDWDD